jgi:archaeal flagellar protein FlaI
MGIFSKKDKSTDKKKKSEQIHNEDTKKQKTPIEIQLKEKSKINKTKETVDEVYPWLDQKKIEEPTANDFPNNKYVDEPKWKHHTNITNKKEKTDKPKVEISPKTITPAKKDETTPSWYKENKIEEPTANDFPNNKYVDEPKWKHPTEKTMKPNEKSKAISKETAHGLTVKESPKSVETNSDIFNKIKNENPSEKIEPKKKDNFEQQKETLQKLIEKNKKTEKVSPPKTETDSFAKLKELASKKEVIPTPEKNSGQKLEEMLKKELSTPPTKPSTQSESKTKIENTKFDWLKEEVIEKPKANDFLTEEIIPAPKWKHLSTKANKSSEIKTDVIKSTSEYSWMENKKIEEPTANDFASQTKEIVATPKWKHEIPKAISKSSIVGQRKTNHPKWIHDKVSPTTTEKTTPKIISTVSEPKWKKDVVPIKKKRSSLKTPIDEIFELLESYKQADTGELAEYTKIDIYIIEKIMRMFEDYGIVEVRYPTTLGKKPIVKLKKEVESKTVKTPEGKVLETYEMTIDYIPAKVSIILVPDEARPIYNIEMPTIGKYTRSFLNYIKNEIAEALPMELDEILDPKKAKQLKNKFFTESKKQLTPYFPNNKTNVLDQLSGVVLHEMYGLGDLEIVMGDDMLEEVAINSSKTPVTVYHRIHGWLKTNLLPGTEEEILNYSSQIGRKIGRDITVLNPILDAHLLSGDRVNATLFPISAEGNTLTIRRFARRPWTIIDFIGKAHTMNTEMAALLWLAMQYEMNILLSGGTASGKTSSLNTLLSLVPSYHRIISIEDVRELVLPKYLKWNWIPMVTRSANPEGLGQVTMLDCMVTSLRMRPDRIIVGEVRRKKEAEVLMEAIETGHSIYSTMHANSAYQVLRRLAEPPMNVPPVQIELIDLVVVQYRDRKTNRRRTFEISEIEQTSTGKGLQVNTIYKWSPRTDDWEQLNKPTKLLTLLNLHTGLTEEDIEKELATRKKILDWMRVQNINELDTIGFIMKLYYSNTKRVIDLADRKATKDEIEGMVE